jgi:antitoxin component YwqK of YwqJK toxin-antitoxin module
MKNTLIIIFIFILTQYANSQDYNTAYYNLNWEVTSMKYGKYFRTSGFDPQKMTFDSLVIDHFMDGSIEMTGKYINGLKEGDFIYYRQNHQIKLSTNYNNNARSGTWTEYFENGQINKEVVYADNKEKLTKFFDINGKSILKEETGKYSSTYYYNPKFGTYSAEKDSDYSIKYSVKGKLENGFKSGTWIVEEYQIMNILGPKGWIPKETPKILCKIDYKNGTFISGTYYLPDGLKKNILSDLFTFLILEPEKILITETFILEPGQLIKLNYLISALQNSKQNSEIHKNFQDASEIIDFFNSNYSLYAKECTDTFRIKIFLKLDDSGKVELDSIAPKTTSSYEKEAIRVIKTMPKIDNYSKKDLNFVYRILCQDELDFKK